LCYERNRNIKNRKISSSSHITHHRRRLDDFGTEIDNQTLFKKCSQITKAEFIRCFCTESDFKELENESAVDSWQFQKPNFLFASTKKF